MLVGLAALAALCSCSPDASTAGDDAAVTISVSACGTGWTNTAAGAHHITLHNTDSRAGSAQLIAPSTGAVFAEVEPLGPGTTDAIDVRLAAGEYAWRCLMEDEAAVVGPTVHVTGSAQDTTPGVRPVNQADLIDATQAYERYVSGRLPGLLADTRELRADLARNDLTAARRDWLVGHLRYETLGAAYDAFGDLDGAINGLPNGLSGGVHDPHWTGFHRIEYDVWHGAPRTDLINQADRLVDDVAALRHQFAIAQIDPATVAIRAHEICENALQFELTGRTDFGSHSQLQTVHANLVGTIVVLGVVHDLLAPRYPALPHVMDLLHAALADVAAPAGHERIDADVSELCELLAPVATILEPRRTS
jgi:iron uptake system component EfeO